jgi:Kef-type K+ transport system membrane component KefB
MGSVLLHILVVLVAAKLAAEGAERVRLPAVVGEIVAGIVIGPSVLGLVDADEVLRTLGELGVILLLLQVGLEMDLAELGAVGKAAVSVAVIGVVLPMVMGVGVMAAFGEPGKVALFVGAALTATSVGITARVFGDLRALASVEARTVLGAAVADDVLGLVILTVVVRVVAEGGISPATVVGVVGLAVLFLVVTSAAGTRFAPPLFQAVHRISRSPGTLVALALAFALGVAELASLAKLAPIVGAFVAGLSLARSSQAERIRKELTPVGHLFVPVFFLQIGIDADLGAMFKPHVLLLAGGLLAVAVLGKIAAAVGTVGSPGDKWLVGLGMLPRGEVGLIFAGLGLREGVLNNDLYGALLLVILATTLVTPPLLGWRLRTIEGRRRRQPVQARPAGGWLSIDTSGLVDLAAEPPEGEAVHVALDAALYLARGRPGPRLLGWFSTLPDGPLPWDARATRSLLKLLAEGNARSWRFLDTTGVLERALPELGAALRRRRDDRSELDPLRALRWSLVDRVHELATDPETADQYARLEHPEWLQLAAVALEVDVAESRQLVKRLDLGAEAEQEIALLVGESGLLQAAARRVDGLDQDRVFELAAHLEKPERARALYLLSVALNALEPWDRSRLDELHARIQAVLADAELTGREARNLLGRRLREAAELAGSPEAADRIEHTPRAYALRQDPATLARQADLLATLPGPKDVRVAVMPVEGGARIEVAARDRVGLLATVSAVLATVGLDVLDADAATWGDGGAVESFLVRCDDLPDAGDLAARIKAAINTELTTPPVPEAAISFDDDASPWYTLCEVTAPDKPGLLSALTAAFVVGDVNVHSAHITTEGNLARDRFELTDADGHKLAERHKAAIAQAIAQGSRIKRGRFGVTRKPLTVP